MGNNMIGHSENSTITIMNCTSAEYIAHLERLLEYKDAVIADKERKIYDLLNTYRLHIDEKDKEIRYITDNSYRRNKIKIAMLVEKDRQIAELISIIAKIREKE